MDLELLPADENGTFCVVDDVITDASQEGSSELAHSSSSGYNHVGFFFFCYGDDCLPCFSFFGHEFRRFNVGRLQFLLVLLLQNFDLFFNLEQQLLDDSRALNTSRQTQVITKQNKKRNKRTLKTQKWQALLKRCRLLTNGSAEFGETTALI